MALTDKELLDVYSNAAMAVWPADGNNAAGLRAVYAKGRNDGLEEIATAIQNHLEGWIHPEHRYGLEDAIEIAQSLKNQKE